MISNQAGERPVPFRARVFRKLRVSLTRSCNFACIYCAADGKAVVDSQVTPPEKFVRWIKEILRVQPLSKIRLTGGEPTLYPYLLQLVAEIKKLTSATIHLTTNGHRLSTLASPLRDAGLDGVNISLDAVEPEIFKAMGGRNYAAVIQGVHDAVDAGLEVKINTTLMAEMNDNQILPLLDFAYALETRGLGVSRATDGQAANLETRGLGVSRATDGKAANHRIILRFLELMAMGHLHGSMGRRLVTAAQILNTIRSRHEVTELGRQESDTAGHYQLERGQVFGIIANNTKPFCVNCDRLRLDALGRVYGCLSNPHGIALDGVQDTVSILSEAMALKQQQQFTGSELLMREVGG